MLTFKFRYDLIILIVFFSCQFVNAQNYLPSKENLEAREKFRDDAYGMFIHWGVYSLMAGGGDLGLGEWIMERKELSIHDYEKLAGFFNPIEFDAKEWVSLVKKGGMKYITITTKHHDGFAMYNSKISDYDIVDSTPYGKDILAELKKACDEEGIELFFYYSQLDWHHPDYYPRGRTGGNYTGRPESGNWENYLKYQNGQLKEILTQYGDIGGIWFDGWWDRQQLPDQGNWDLKSTYELIHSLQPAALIGNNHHLVPFSGEDFQMFEKDLPGKNKSGLSPDSEIGNLPLETCETVNGSWGFNLTDNRYKSVEELIHYLVKASGNNANFLLNVGPMPNGEIQKEFVERIEAVGQWLEVNGESIYGTRGGSWASDDWGVSTTKGNTTYIHLLNSEVKRVVLTDFNDRIKSSVTISGKEVKFKQLSDGIVILDLKGIKRDKYDTVVKIILK